MRTQDEIVARLNQNKESDILGFESEQLVNALDFEHAKPWLKPEVTAEQWDKGARLRDDKDVIAAMHDYIDFAWGKAINGRGISAGRSMCKYQSWLWLIGQDKLSESCSDYQYYGKDQLCAITKFLGLDPAKFDDGLRVN